MRLFVGVSLAVLRLRAFTKEREKELWLGSNMLSFLCMAYPVTWVFLFAVHLARFLYASRSLCSFHQSMSQTRHAPWLLLLITKVTGGWVRHVSFIIVRLGHCSGWRWKTTKFEYLNSGLSLPNKDKIPKVYNNITTKKVKEYLFFLKDGLSNLTSNWRHWLYICFICLLINSVFFQWDNKPHEGRDCAWPPLRISLTA